MWHELKRQVLPPVAGIGLGVGVGASELGGHFGTVSLFESDSQAQLVSNKLKENLRASAVLLATTRQVRNSLVVFHRAVLSAIKTFLVFCFAFALFIYYNSIEINPN